MEPAGGADASREGTGRAEALARRAREGDEAAFAALVEEHAAPLFRFFRARGADEHDAEDLVQETFLKLYEARRRYDPAYAFRTWLFTVGRRCQVSRWRRERRRVRLPAAAGAALEAAPDRSAVVEAAGVARLWTRARQALPERQYEALWLRYGEELPMAEVAAVMEITEGNARVLLHRARAGLQRELEEEDETMLAPQRVEGGA
jgi:RNA polymerase sigma-70 factor (ECF subfamily)